MPGSRRPALLFDLDAYGERESSLFAKRSFTSFVIKEVSRQVFDEEKTNNCVYTLCEREHRVV